MAFLGANGIDAVNGVTTNIYQEAKIYENIARNCTGKIVLVATGNKLGKTYTFKSLDLNAIDLLITDSTADRNPLFRFESGGNAGMFCRFTSSL